MSWPISRLGWPISHTEIGQTGLTYLGLTYFATRDRSTQISRIMLAHCNPYFLFIKTRTAPRGMYFSKTLHRSSMKRNTMWNNFCLIKLIFHFHKQIFMFMHEYSHGWFGLTYFAARDRSTQMGSNGLTYLAARDRSTFETQSWPISVDLSQMRVDLSRAREIGQVS